MADIFISYSSKDREKAEQFTELLSSAGLSVWIDQAGLEVSNSWSKEIVAAINDCKAFVVLLSPNSLESHNVIKEVSLASEKRKKILPLELEPITLTDDFEYQLAGIHRTSMTNIDSIIRALGKLGLEATQAPTMKLVKETDSRKSLMILPFEDLSPTHDNQWFADGLVGELIGSLSVIKKLKLVDAQTTKEFKKYSGPLTIYAREMSVRYFIQGSVRKMGDNIKIMTQLLDIETGDYLWQDSLKGTMEDIFDIQESVAKKVVEGLKIHLTHDEQSKLEQRGTKNEDAWECFNRAIELTYTQTEAARQETLSLLETAVQLDPTFYRAWVQIAHRLILHYESVKRDEGLLEQAELALSHIPGDLEDAHSTKALYAMARGDIEGAEKIYRNITLARPDDPSAFGQYAYMLFRKGEYSAARMNFEKAIALGEDSHVSYWNVLVNAAYAHEEVSEEFILKAIRIHEQWNRLHPGDTSNLARLAYLLVFSKRQEEGRELLAKIESSSEFNAFALHVAGRARARLREFEQSLINLRKAFLHGYGSKEMLTTNPDLILLRGNPGYEALIQELDRRQGEMNG
jgi:adenylate cyclase